MPSTEIVTIPIRSINLNTLLKSSNRCISIVKHSSLTAGFSNTTSNHTNAPTLPLYYSMGHEQIEFPLMPCHVRSHINVKHFNVISLTLQSACCPGINDTVLPPPHLHTSFTKVVTTGKPPYARRLNSVPTPEPSNLSPLLR